MDPNDPRLDEMARGATGSSTATLSVPERSSGPTQAQKSNETVAHKLLNGLVTLWTLGYLAAVVFAIIAPNDNWAAGKLANLVVPAVLFVPWVMVLLALIALRSTTRAR